MKQTIKQYGFTLLEMLSALAIIAVLIGLLIPAISKIQDTAHTVKQKAQFSAIEIALEAFNADTGDYPPSSYTGVMSANGYCGAQKLAEAIVGMDGFGFHPKSQWHVDGREWLDTDGNGTIDTYIPLYSEATGYNAFYPTDPDKHANRKARKGPYLELEKANAVKVGSMYKSNPNVDLNTFVLADMFANVKNSVTGKKTGMPILYFKADASKSLHNPANPTQSIYNTFDNMPFIAVKAPLETPQTNPMIDSTYFYNRTANPNFTAPQRPYRATSFILLSAGADGVYGSADDVYNVDENEK
jgi:prepilin-type N-terminal cleavage/methylation domain-containing protein